MLDSIRKTIENIVHKVVMSQSVDGSFRFCFESGFMTDAYMIVLLRALMIHEEDLIQMLTQRISNLQNASGTWKLFHDEESGNLSTTLDAYYALLASGSFKKTNDRMQTAKHFILKKGGMQNSGMLTQAILAMTGQLAWPTYFRFPLEIILLPNFAPINFYEFVGYARVHLLPVIITNSRKFTIQSKLLPNLSELQSRFQLEGPVERNARSLSDFMQEAIKHIQNLPKTLGNIPKEIHVRAIEQAKQFILKRIETNGTFYGYASCTYLLVFAWLSLGYTREHPVIQQAIAGLKSLIFHQGDLIHLQNTSSTVWDTSLLSYTLQEAGIPEHALIIQKANAYVLSHQQTRGGDWQLHNPHVLPGGWGFSDVNTFNPDVDDTAAALRAIRTNASHSTKYEQAWKKGYDWILSMQNNDGGWPAFEKNVDNPILSGLHIDGSTSILTDPSTADLTGRILEILGSNGHSMSNTFIERAANWLIRHQESDGSWFGRWGVCYIYGTWAAVTGLMAIGMSAGHPTIKKAIDWILSIQNADGGWGESCKSDHVKTYVALGHSTPSQTAWAIDALISVFDRPIPAIESGIHCLIELQAQPYTDWRIQYPTGAGLPGRFYTNYHSYGYIWPLLAFAHYQKRYSETK